MNPQALNSNPTHPQPSSVDVLLVSQNPLWPLDQGYKIRGYNMAVELTGAGVRTAVACLQPLPQDTPEHLKKLVVPWAWPTPDHAKHFNAQWAGPARLLRNKLADHQGLNPVELAGLVTLARGLNPSVVIALGQHAPILLRGLQNIPDLKRIWYAADELITFHLSCLRSDPWPQIPSRLRRLAVCAGIETLFAPGLDGAIGVSPRDTALLRRIASVNDAITIRNGVDLDYFKPTPSFAAQPRRRSLIFWGRLDFEPNTDAVRWFAQNVWPRLRARHPDASWKIAGKNPTPEIWQLTTIPGIDLIGSVDDIRPLAQQAALVVMPMRRGGGIKNKFLEAAAMACPVVASPRTLDGLEYDPHYPPAWVCHNPDQWTHTILELWNKDTARHEMGRNALNWARRHHSWRNAARSLITWLNVMVGRDLRTNPTHEKNSTDEPRTYPTDFLQRWAA